MGNNCIFPRFGSKSGKMFVLATICLYTRQVWSVIDQMTLVFWYSREQDLKGWSLLAAVFSEQHSSICIYIYMYIYNQYLQDYQDCSVSCEVRHSVFASSGTWLWTRVSRGFCTIVFYLQFCLAGPGAVFFNYFYDCFQYMLGCYIVLCIFF